MKNVKNLFTVAFISAALLFSACEQQTELQSTPDHVSFLENTDGSIIIPGQYIVTLRADMVPASKFKADMPYAERMDIVKDIAQKLVVEVTGTQAQITHAYHKAIQGFAGKLSAEAVALLQNDPRVVRIEQDQIIGLAPPPGKGPGGGGGGDPAPAEETPWGIGRVNGGVSASEHTAWIIDSGIDLDHDDLNVDVARSATFLGGKTTPDDQHGHGTHVAGTVAAIKGNNIGVVGVAPGTTVVAVRVLDRRGSGSLSGVIAGVNYVAANAQTGDVANMSLGGGVSTSLDQAVVNASSACKFVLAAGNETDHANNHSPARANGTNVYTASASDINDRFASFSNYGNPPIDWCEPGVSIKSCYKGNQYATMSGTSMAAPHLTGILLLTSTPADGGTVTGDRDSNPDHIGTL